MRNLATLGHVSLIFALAALTSSLYFVRVIKVYETYNTLLNSLMTRGKPCINALSENSRLIFYAYEFVHLGE